VLTEALTHEETQETKLFFNDALRYRQKQETQTKNKKTKNE